MSSPMPTHAPFSRIFRKSTSSNGLFSASSSASLLIASALRCAFLWAFLPRVGSYRGRPSSAPPDAASLAFLLRMTSSKSGRSDTTSSPPPSASIILSKSMNRSRDRSLRVSSMDVGGDQFFPLMASRMVSSSSPSTFPPTSSARVEERPSPRRTGVGFADLNCAAAALRGDTSAAAASEAAGDGADGAASAAAATSSPSSKPGSSSTGAVAAGDGADLRLRLFLARRDTDDADDDVTAGVRGRSRADVWPAPPPSDACRTAVEGGANAVVLPRGSRTSRALRRDFILGLL
mmetsp:Transcript_4290/g.9857  ORF Transcript_4290/g.9857 Transcript_4290/m.9857 type:complete len:291 (-) Transcript_4290:8-880(-)